jgi:hypothetical protein
VKNIVCNAFVIEKNDFELYKLYLSDNFSLRDYTNIRNYILIRIHIKIKDLFFIRIKFRKTNES